MTYIFGDLGRNWSIFRDLGSKGKILLGSQGNNFQGSWEMNALFSGIKGAQTPPPPGGAHYPTGLLLYPSDKPSIIISPRAEAPGLIMGLGLILRAITKPLNIINILFHYIAV